MNKKQNKRAIKNFYTLLNEIHDKNFLNRPALQKAFLLALERTYRVIRSFDLSKEEIAQGLEEEIRERTEVLIKSELPFDRKYPACGKRYMNLISKIYDNRGMV
jgi:hypothetical protein